MDVLTAIVLVYTIAMIHFWLRNTRTHAFKKEIIQMEAEYYRKHPDEFEDTFPLTERFTYGRMLWSTRPLELKYWYHPEDLEKFK